LKMKIIKRLDGLTLPIPAQAKRISCESFKTDLPTNASKWGSSSRRYLLR